MNRILQIVQRPQRRGAEMFVYDLSRRFEELGLETKTLYLYDFEGDHGLPLHPPDMCLSGPERHPFEKVPGIHPSLLARLAAEIDAFSPDVVQVNGARTVKYGAAVKRWRGSRARWRLVYRNIGMVSHWHQWWGTILVYRRAIMPLMDGIVGLSQVSLNDARTFYHLRVPFTVIPNGITPSRLKPGLERGEARSRYGAGASDVVLLFVGHLEAAKRPDRFVRLVARASREHPGVRGWVVGDGPLRESAERLAERLGLGGRIRFFGVREDVATFMNGADVFVVTSDTEGVPAVVLEAGYLGLPVVTTDVGGVSECVEDGVTGLVAEGTSETDLARRVLELASDEPRRARLGESARRKIRRDFTVESLAEQYLDFYGRIGVGRRHALV